MLIHAPFANRRWPPQPAELRLANGLRVLFLEREESPLTEMRLVLDGGFAGEQRGQSGCAGFATAMLSHGALHLAGGDLRTMLRPLGTTVGGRVAADAAIVALSTLAVNIKPTLSALAAVLSNPTFTPDDFEAVRAERLALIAREMRNYSELATRVLPAMIYPPGNPYARPFSGSGTISAVGALDPGRLRAWYANHLLPGHATLIVVGASPIESITSTLERTIGQWKPATAGPGTADFDDPETVPDHAQAGVVLAERPGNSQAGLFAGLPGLPRSVDGDALTAADAVLARMFTSRLNLQLREARAWSYGVRSSLLDTRASGWWLISTFVREDRTVEAMDLIVRELENLAGAHPCSAQELAGAVNYLIGQAYSRYETRGQAADALAGLAVLGLPAFHDAEAPDRLRRLEIADITRAVARVLDRQAPRWLIGVDTEKVTETLRASGRNPATLDRD